MVYEILVTCCWVVAGHMSGALALYLNHRFVFHGQLGKIKILRGFSRLHELHHKHAYSSDRNDYLKTPDWGKYSLSTLMFMAGVVINWWFAVGLFTFAILYSVRHFAIHNHDNFSNFFYHHEIHHQNIRYNFSGMYPFIDRVFGTIK